MHVVIATGLYPPDIGGPATFAVFLEKQFARHGISYTTVPFRLVRHRPKILRHLNYFTLIRHAIKPGSIVLALDPVSAGLPARLAAAVAGAPFYLRVGGDYAWEQASQRGFSGTPEEFATVRSRLSPSIQLLVAIESFVARGAHAVLTQSSYLADIVQGWGVPRERIAVVPNSVETLAELPSRSQLRDEWKWGSERVIVSAGRFVPWKGFGPLIDAVDELSKKHEHVRLVIAGEGPEGAMLRERAKKARARVDVLGPLHSDKLSRLIAAADVFALNTGYEGFSHQLLEAMALGTPVVTTAIGGNRDLAQEGKTALTVPYNDTAALASALDRLLSDGALARELSQSAKAHAARFTPERTFAETCAAIGVETGA